MMNWRTSQMPFICSRTCLPLEMRHPHPSVGPAVQTPPGRRSIANGSPGRVAEQLQGMVDGFGAEELMVVTICHDHEARVHSYELLAAEFGLPTSAVQATSIVEATG